MPTLIPFSLGERVMVDGDPDLDGRVIGIQQFDPGAVRFLVGRWVRGEAREEWFASWRLSPLDKDKE